MKQLYPHQQKAFDAIRRALSSQVRSQLLVMPTGTGKTFTAARTTKDLGRILWIAHTEELLDQAAIALLSERTSIPHHDIENEFKQREGLVNVFRSSPLLSESIGLIKAEDFDIHKDIVMASAQTLHRRLDMIPADHFDVIIADEADLYMANSFRAPLEYFMPRLLLGLTATPFRTDNMPLSDLFGDTVYEYSIGEAIRDGFLCKPDAIKVRTNVSLDSVHTLAGEFKQNELSDTVNNPARNILIVKKYLEYAAGRLLIALCVDVQHSIDLCETFNEFGVKTNYVVGDKELTPERRKVIADFKSGGYVGLTNCMVLSVGFDHPNVGCGIMACPSKSKRKVTQQIGRPLRLKDDEYVAQFGQNCIVLDIVDVTTRHKMVNTDELDRPLPLEEKIFIRESDRQKLLDVKRKRDAIINSAGSDTDERIDLIPLPVIKIPKSSRMKEPATEAQIFNLKRWGYDTENVTYTKVMYAEILGAMSASLEDINNLKSAGYDVTNGVTKAEAYQAFKDTMERDARANALRHKTSKAH